MKLKILFKKQKRNDDPIFGKHLKNKKCLSSKHYNMQKFDCSICASSYSTSKIVNCSACNLETCRNCFQSWILSTDKDPECMGCKAPISWDQLNEKTTKVFITKAYREHRRKVLLDRERSLYPMTMPLLEREKQARNMRDLIRSMNQQIINLRHQIWELEKTKKDTERARNQLLNGVVSLDDAKNITHTKCPVEECRGFLNQQHVCSVCENKICSSCMEIKKEKHICDPSKVETVKLIKAETKPCPCCGTRIQKTHGCDQMWCVDCKTFFSWNTGEVITKGPLHNPEYLEWMRRSGGVIHREIGDQYCGGMPHILIENATLQKLCKKLDNNEIKRVTDIEHEIRETTRALNHNIDILNTFPIRGLEQVNQEMRVSFLIGDITEEELARDLQLNERNNNYNNEMRTLLGLVQEVVSDKMRELLTQEDLENNRGWVRISKVEKAETMLKHFEEKVRLELSEFREFMHQAFAKVARRYNRITKTVNKYFLLGYS